VFESILEASPSAAADLVAHTSLLSWLLARVKVRGFHANKLYASELLAILTAQNEGVQAAVGGVDGILALLTATSQYKRKEPADLEEAELIENLFDTLTSVLELPANQHAFLRAEGIELMVLTLKEQKYAARGALKALDAALAANGANVERFVDIRGFKTLFPMLGSPPPPPPPFAKGRAEREAAQRSHDAHVTSLVCTCFHQLTDERRQRLLGKFAEDEMGKVARVLGMRGAYDARVADAADSVDDGGDEEDDEGDGEYEERLYLARVDAGLGTLHALDTILGYLAAARNKPIRTAVLHGLYAQERSLHDVVASIDEHARIGLGADSRADPARDAAMSTMSDAVHALLRKYAPAGESSAGAEASGA
jgi:beta-catenin-like protein 1